MAVKPEDRCAQYLTEDRNFICFEFADMDASSYPAFTHVFNIGRVAVCKQALDFGSTYERSSDEGYKIPNLQVGQRMIIAQVPACNPLTRYAPNLELTHKTIFILVHLIWDEVDGTSSNFVESKLSLVDYSVLRIMSPEDETALRRKLAWENDEAIPR